jgi:hypothetical protein
MALDEPNCEDLGELFVGDDDLPLDLYELDSFFAES